MNCRIGDKTIPIGTLNSTGAKEGFPLFESKARIVKTKIWTSTEIAVEFFCIVAFCMFRVEGAKIALFFDHIFKPKILDHFVVAQSGEFIHNNTVFGSVSVEPVFIRH